MNDLKRPQVLESLEADHAGASADPFQAPSQATRECLRCRGIGELVLDSLPHVCEPCGGTGRRAAGASL